MSHVCRPKSLPQAPIEEALELLARRAYDAAHPDDSFEDLKRRAGFSREAAGLFRAWIRAARSGALGSVEPAAPDAGAAAAETRAA
jgi:hypothetical protein